MQPTIVVEHFDSDVCQKREAAAREVWLAFGDLPPGRLLCFFDDQDHCVFKNENVGFGEANRAVSGPVWTPADLRDWPLDIIRHVFSSHSLDDNKPAFDFVIYVHNSTCEDPVGLTMTFAHELQHFVQWATMRSVWKANERFKDWAQNFETGLYSHNLPIEKDARIVAKRIAIRIHGREAVDRYIEKNIASPVNDLDGRNWRFIESIDVAKPYDVEVETEMLDSELKSRPLAYRQT